MTIAALIISVLALAGTGVNLYRLRELRRTVPQIDGPIDWNDQTGLATGVTLRRPTGAKDLQRAVDAIGPAVGKAVAEAMYGAQVRADSQGVVRMVKDDDAEWITDWQGKRIRKRPA